ncbi:MAG: FxsA family protein [Spirochaetaceae bacterium]|nr:MAG: FxsA family protein [Spirochaetaceae bacterium]
MIDYRSLIKNLQSENIFRYFCGFAGLSLLFALDIFIITEAMLIWGNYLVMALISACSLILLAFATNTVLRTNRVLRKKIRQGIYPAREFTGIASLILAAILFIFPGCITNTIGFLIMLPPFRSITGNLLVKTKKTQLQETYEYLKIQEFSRG